MITGVLYKIFETEVHRDFHKRLFWVQQLNVKYPMMWELEMWHDECETLNMYRTGMIVECEYRPIGRIYEDRNLVQKVKTSLQCTNIKQV